MDGERSCYMADKITIKGVLENPETKLTRNATAYVEADLITPTTKIRIRNWEASADQLQPYTGKVVEVVGGYEVYGGKETFNFGFIGSDIAITATGEDPTESIYSIPYKPEAILKTLKKEIKGFQNENYKHIATYLMDFIVENGIHTAAFPPVHTEQGGLLHHIYLVVSRLKKHVLPTFRGVETQSVSIELMITLSLLENIGVLCPLFQPDIDGLLFGANNNLVRGLLVLGNMPEKELYAEEIAILSHGLLVLSGSVPPAIQDIALVKRVADEELETYHFSEARRFMSPGEVKNNVFNLIS